MINFNPLITDCSPHILHVAGFTGMAINFDSFDTPCLLQCGQVNSIFYTLTLELSWPQYRAKRRIVGQLQ